MGLEMINEMRKQCGWGLDELSLRSGVPKSTLSKITAGITKNPSLETIRAIVYCMGYTLNDLIVDSTNPINDKIQDEKEATIIKKYRTLDEYGKEVVDSVLEIEHKRYIEQIKEKTQSEDAVKIMYIQYNDQKASAGTGFTLDYEHMTRWGVQYNDLTKKADFCVDVEGDSMEPRFYDGDTLLIRRQSAVDVGEIGLFILDGKGYVKKWGGDKLISLNPKYEDIEIEENSRLDCAGKVLGVLDPDWIIET